MVENGEDMVKRGKQSRAMMKSGVLITTTMKFIKNDGSSTTDGWLKWSS